MKKVITLFGASLLALSAQAQITLTNTGYTHLIGIDTTRAIDTSSFSVAALATAHTNYTWDLTSYPYDPGSVSFQRFAPSPAFAGASYGERITYNFSAVSYTDTAEVTVGAAGVARVGESMARQANSLLLLTGATTDSLVFNGQNIVYSGGSNNRIQFPATYNSTWSSGYIANTGYAITYISVGLNNTPGIRRSYVQMRDTVIGWGSMKVNDFSGAASGLIPILQIKETYTSTDSFFLAGNPAPAALLAGFGLAQGMVTSDYRIYFYRVGETQPLASVSYTDNTMTKSRQNKMYVHTQRLAPSGIRGIYTDKDVTVYPNPVTNHQLNVKLPVGSTTWSYELINVAGQKVSAAQINAVSGKATIAVPQALQPGIYYLSLLASDGSTIIRQVSLN